MIRTTLHEQLHISLYVMMGFSLVLLNGCSKRSAQNNNTNSNTVTQEQTSSNNTSRTNQNNRSGTTRNTTPSNQNTHEKISSGNRNTDQQNQNSRLTIGGNLNESEPRPDQLLYDLDTSMKPLRTHFQQSEKPIKLLMILSPT